MQIGAEQPVEKPVQNAPLVSVCVIACNNEPHIRQALDSILLQDADFPFEICLGVDESSDATQDICREYLKRHPDKIRLFLRDAESRATRGCYNHVQTILACTGKYIAFLDGDDYWTDPRKLALQVKTMEARPDAVLVHTDHDRVSTASRRLHECQVAGGHHALSGCRLDEDHALEEIVADERRVWTGTVLARTQLVQDIVRHSELYNAAPVGDTPIWVELAARGRVIYLPWRTASHRRVAGSLSFPTDPLTYARFHWVTSQLSLRCVEVFGLDAKTLASVRRRFLSTAQYAWHAGDRALVLASLNVACSAQERFCSYRLRLLHLASHRPTTWRFVLWIRTIPLLRRVTLFQWR